MERSSHKTIIEFNGLPGCGKSTVGKELYNMLPPGKATYPYVLPIGKFWLIIKSIFDGSIIFIFYCLLILRKFKSSSRKEKLYLLIGAYYHFQLYKHFLDYSDKEYMIVDQGLVQDVISFAYCDSIKSKKYVSKMMNFCFRKFEKSLCIINCDIDIETSLNRISYRGKTDGSRLDKLISKSREKARRVLETQQNNFVVLRDIVNKLCYSHIEIRLDKVISDNSKAIYSFIINE